MESSKAGAAIRKWTPAQRLELLRKYKLAAGTVTQRRFCLENGLGLSTLSLRLRQRKGNQPSAAEAESPKAFIPLQVFPPQREAVLEIVLPEIGRVKVHGPFDPGPIASLVKAMLRS